MSVKEGGDDEKLEKQLGITSKLLLEMENLGLSDSLFLESICKRVSELPKKISVNATLKLSENVLGLFLKDVQDYQLDRGSSISYQGRVMRAKEGGEDEDLQKLLQLGLISALMKDMERQLGFSDRVFVESIIGSGCKTVPEFRKKLTVIVPLKLSNKVPRLLLKPTQDNQLDSCSSSYCQGREGGDDEKLKKQLGLSCMLLLEMENLGFSDRVFVEFVCKTVADLPKKISVNATLKLSDNILGLFLKGMQDYRLGSGLSINYQGRAMLAKRGGEDEDLHKLLRLGLISALMKEMEIQLGFSDRVFVESIIGSGCKMVAELRKKISTNVTLKMSNKVLRLTYLSDSPSTSTEPRLFGVYRGRVGRVLAGCCQVWLLDCYRKRGWLYKNEMARWKIENAWDVVQPDQEVFVKIISIIGRKLVFSMWDVEQQHGRDLLPLDRERYLRDRATASAIVPGQPELFRVYKGKVGRVTQNFCFVLLVDFRGTEGLLRKSQMANWDPSDAREVVKTGQSIFVRVISNVCRNLVLSMLDVDQKNGKDLRPLNRRIGSQSAITEGVPKTQTPPSQGTLP